jgi:hypothetical protein
MDIFKRVTQNIAYPTLAENEERQYEKDEIKYVMGINKTNFQRIHMSYVLFTILSLSIFLCRSDTDSGRSSDYRIDDNKVSSAMTLDLESNKYFSLPRPKYNPKANSIASEIYEKPKTRAAVVENRRGGRRFTVDIASNDVATALADIGIKSRSNTHLNAIYESEMKISTLPNMKLKKEAAKSDGENQLMGPEFIINANSIANVIDITDNKVN